MAREKDSMTRKKDKDDLWDLMKPLWIKFEVIKEDYMGVSC